MLVHSETQMRSVPSGRHVRREMTIEFMNVFVIGACNVNDGIYALASDGNIRPPVVAGIRKLSDGQTPYVHSGQEAVQFVRYVREDMDIPKSLRKYVFTDAEFSPKGRSAAFDEADVILFEFSTPLEIEFGQFRLNRNELQRRLIVPLRQAVPALVEPLGEWFQEGILKANSELAASAAADVLAGLPNNVGDAAEWRELICGTRGRLLRDAEIVGLLRQLNEMLRTKLAVVMPSLQYTPDGRGWGWPSEFIGQLEDACAELCLPLLDFSAVIRRYGTDAALMPDLYHHRPGFTGFFDEMLRFTREVVSK